MPRTTDHTRELVVGLLLSSAALVCIQFAAKPMGFPPIPPRLFVFVLVVDFGLICFLLWQKRRATTVLTNAKAAEANAAVASNLAGVAKSLGFYALLEAAVCGLASIAFRLTAKKLLVPYLLFLIPPVVAQPLLIYARRFRHQPKAYAFRVAMALAIFAILIVLGMYYSGILNWFIPGQHDIGELVFTIAFVAITVGFMAYRSVSARMLSSKP
jgi:hypothetical protein